MHHYPEASELYVLVPACPYSCGVCADSTGCDREKSRSRASANFRWSSGKYGPQRWVLQAPRMTFHVAFAVCVCVSFSLQTHFFLKTKTPHRTTLREAKFVSSSLSLPPRPTPIPVSYLIVSVSLRLSLLSGSRTHSPTNVTPHTPPPPVPVPHIVPSTSIYTVPGTRTLSVTSIHLPLLSLFSFSLFPTGGLRPGNISWCSTPRDGRHSPLYSGERSFPLPRVPPPPTLILFLLLFFLLPLFLFQRPPPASRVRSPF